MGDNPVGQGEEEVRTSRRDNVLPSSEASASASSNATSSSGQAGPPPPTPNAPFPADLVPFPSGPVAPSPVTPHSLRQIWTFLLSIAPPALRQTMLDTDYEATLTSIYGHTLHNPDWSIAWFDVGDGDVTFKIVDSTGAYVTTMPELDMLTHKGEYTYDDELMLNELMMDELMMDEYGYPEYYPAMDTGEAVVYVDALEEVDVASSEEGLDKCPGCWLPFGVEDEGELPLHHPDDDEDPVIAGNLLAFRALPFDVRRPNNDPVRTPCGHVFGRSCLIESLVVSTLCPMCRKELWVGEVEEMDWV